MLKIPATYLRVNQWSLSLHGPDGLLSRTDSQEAQFIIGSEEAADVLRVTGDGIAPRHALVWIAEGRMQVEDLAGGTLVNGNQIVGRIEADYPVSVQVGPVTLVVEAAAVVPDHSVAVTIPQLALNKGRFGTTVTVPQKTPVRSNLQPLPPAGRPTDPSAPADKALTTCEYTLVREIARGGMGQIYFGKDPNLEREVAVKVSSVSQEGEDPRFEKEAKVLAHLAHPNIVPIYNIGVDAQNRPFYAMKLVKGRNLQAILNAASEGDPDVVREYPRTKLLTIFQKVCDAMAFAHAKGVLHRDLKPDNIMVGEYGEVLVMDWGLAKILGGPEDAAAGNAPQQDTGDYGMTMEGEVIGTPQYMSPEQAEGMVAELDARSDIYSLGGILYAILTLRAPIEGRTLNEVLTKVRNGEISSMATKRRIKGRKAVGAPLEMSGEVPSALQAVTLKAMATDRERRYRTVEAFAADIDAYQNGFATSAEDAGAWRRGKLWVGRNKVLSGAVAVMFVVVSGFTSSVLQKGREATSALARLRETAPTFAARARDALQEGGFEEALKSINFAVDLSPQNGAYHELRADVLQVLVRWPDAIKAYRAALRYGTNERAKVNLELTESLTALAKEETQEKANGVLFEALNKQGRQSEALAFGKELGDFWKDRKTDANALRKLVKILETKLLPVPGTDVLMCSTELTVGEWKLYLKAEGLSEWRQPTDEWLQTDEHPVVCVGWRQAKVFCDWLSAKTGKEWRLPVNSEWDAAVGTTKHPWGDYYPPHWDDGNYKILEDGKGDPHRVGVDGILGTAPVASFKPNILGFYDLGGNVGELMWDLDEKTGECNWRGSSWFNYEGLSQSSHRLKGRCEISAGSMHGLRLVRRSGP